MRAIRTGLIALALLSAGGLVIALGIGYALSRPVPRNVGPAPMRMAAEEVNFESESGAQVRGWWVPAPHPRASVLLLPGVRANRLSMVGRAELLRKAGYSVLLIDLQGTGETAGELITFGWRERLDVLAAVAFLRAIDEKTPVAIIGMSLGGAAALLATPPLRVDALVLEAVYPSIERAVKNRLAIRLGRAGEALAPLLLIQLQPRLGVGAAQLRPVDRIGSVGCPVLIIGGASDRHTTPEDTLQLYAAARSPKSLWLVKNASHVDLQRSHPDEYEKRVLGFLEQALVKGGLTSGLQAR